MLNNLPIASGRLRERQAWVKSVATAVPRYRFSQADALERACHFIPRFASLAGVFDHTGVESRYSCVPLDWYRETRGWKESNAVYVEHSLDLLHSAAQQALAGSDLDASDITAIVLVSSTGLAIPSLEARLCNRMGFARNVERTPVFGLGCAGGTTGLARASQVARSTSDSAVLLLVVELAGINVHVDPGNPALFVSAALFGDGAAAVVLRSVDPGDPVSGGGASVRIGPTGEHMWPDTEYVMGWDVEDDGLNVILSGELPSFTLERLRCAVLEFLHRHDLDLPDLDGFIVHPGGPRVLDAIEQALGPGPECPQAFARGVARLREHVRSDGPVRPSEDAPGREPRTSSHDVVRTGFHRHVRGSGSLNDLLGPAQVFAALLLFQRGVEELHSQRNTRRLLREGAVEIGADYYPVVAVTHLCWIAAICFLISPDAHLSLPLLAVFLPLQLARYWVIATLGRYWTHRIITLPSAPVVRVGPYRYMRHPNYLITFLETLVVPAALGAWVLGIIMTAIWGAVLLYKIRLEDSALGSAP